MEHLINLIMDDVTAATDGQQVMTSQPGNDTAQDPADQAGQSTLTQNEGKPVKKTRRRRRFSRSPRRKPRVFNWPKQDLFDATCVADEASGSMVGIDTMVDVEIDMPVLKDDLNMP